MGLFSIFKKKVKHDQASTILWEDDYLMIEILPIDNLEHALKETKRVNEFGQEHFDGNGFTNITEIQGGPKATQELSIKLTDLTDTIEEAGMKRIQKVFYEGKPIDSTETIVYGENKNGLYIEQENGTVRAVWLAFYNRSRLPNSVFVNGLKAIGNKFEMIMVDWNRGDIVDLTDEIGIKKYLEN